jgi:hypothetical protein
MPPDGAKISAQPINDGRVLLMPKTLQDLCEIRKATGRPVIGQDWTDGPACDRPDVLSARLNEQ